jgi:hypothetical protein
MKTWLNRMMAASLLVFAVSCGDDDDGGTPDAGGGPDGSGSPVPNITRVAWAPAGTCNSGVAGNYTINITAVDADTSADQLVFSGMVQSCTPAITSKSQTINCPNAATYQGSVTVKDPQNNMDTQTFSISPCGTGMAP